MSAASSADGRGCNNRCLDEALHQSEEPRGSAAQRRCSEIPRITLGQYNDPHQQIIFIVLLIALAVAQYLVSEGYFKGREAQRPDLLQTLR
jgi:hypothetical protein